MKNLTILFLLCCLSFTAQSQDKILFHVHHKPEMTYEQMDNSTSQTTIKYSGSKEFITKMEEKGMKNPTIKTEKNTTKTQTTTGKMKDNQFPVLMNFLETSNSEGKKPVPDGTLLHAHCELGKLPTIDSIESKDMNEELKQQMLPVLQSAFSQLTYPKKEVKIGESFSDKTPLSIPMGGASLDMDITSTYKLLSVKNGLAIFDVKQVYTMKTKIEDLKMSATGSGKGTITYDIANNFFLHHELKNTMTMYMKTEQFNMELQLVNDNIQDVKIAAAKK